MRKPESRMKLQSFAVFEEISIYNKLNENNSHLYLFYRCWAMVSQQKARGHDAAILSPLIPVKGRLALRSKA